MKMIPISEIDETIKDFKAIAKYDPQEDAITRYVAIVIIPTLEQLRKKAIPAVAVNEVIEVLEKAQNTAEWDIIDDFKWRLRS
jgi:hypothetical protein